MGKITKDMVFCAYEVGKKVFAQDIARLDGSIQVTQATGMERGSAQDYITVLLSMLEGNCYKRTINMFATEYYLNKIGLDFGAEKQRNAAIATLEHVQYYSGIHGYLKSIERIAKKYI